MFKFGRMKVYLIVLVTIGLGLNLTSCKDDVITKCETVAGPSLRMTVQPMFGGQVLYLDSTYLTAEGHKIQFTDLKFYMEDIRNGNTQLIDAALFDYRERGTFLLETEGDIADFSDLQANLGVDSSVNHDNPSAFANASMLNIANSNDMHWAWNPGYIFVKVEGKADTIPDATDLFNHNIVFHVGLDVNLQTLDYSNLNWVTINPDLSELQFVLDMATFLQGSTQNIDVKTEFSSHSSAGQEALTLKVMENFKEALTLF